MAQQVVRQWYDFKTVTGVDSGTTSSKTMAGQVLMTDVETVSRIFCVISRTGFATLDR